MAKKRRKAAKPRIGRPPTGETPRRIFRASDSQWVAYQAAADRDGLNLSAWIRQTLDDAATSKGPQQ